MIIARQIVGSYYIVHAITSTCIYKFIKVLWILWKCIVYGYAYVPPPPHPHPKGLYMYMFLQRSLRLQALVKSNSHWILIKIPLIDY